MKLREKLKEYLELVKFEHTLFAFPFAMSAMLIAKPDSYPTLNTLLWVIIAIITARTATMALNRVIDAKIDAKNPRTKDRAIPAGRIKLSSALVLAIISFTVMIFSVLQLNELCIKLLPLALFILIIYSYTKRFTYLSHLVLGSSLGAAASGAWIATTGEITLPVILWGLAIVFWVSGFDIIYALMDREFDIKEQLFSIPAKFGIFKSLLLSGIFHIITILMLIGVYFLHIKTIYYLAAVIYMSLVLIIEHLVFKKEDIKSINMAFFNMNGLASIGFFLIILVGKVLST